jgi:hypothetical protein
MLRACYLYPAVEDLITFFFSTFIFISVSDRLLEIRLNYKGKPCIYQSFPKDIPTINK